MEHIYRSYYTESDYITGYMVKMLNIDDKDMILEPCGGGGVFIDTILSHVSNAKIDTCDLNQKAVDVLKDKYKGNNNINIWHTDTLLELKFDQYIDSGGHYDKIIGNPPYGGWQEYDKRAQLKEKYNGFYVKETYALFLLRSISLLKHGGILSFIIPDTFLFLHRHTALRSFILSNTKIKEILIFPSKFFPGVNFGYSNLSIITVEKSDSDNAMNNVTRIIKGFKNEKEIEDVYLNRNIDNLIIKEFKQREIYNSQDHVFLINQQDEIVELINSVELKLGDIADCVTGIYSGNNECYFKVYSHDIKGAKNYEIVNENEINDYTELEGIEDNYKKYIPIVKGSSDSRYIRKKNNWYIDWSKEAVYHYNNDKKARFQNAQFYFKKGIALPMVKSSKSVATLMENMVFDQSIVGIFPREEKYLLYMLALLNSETVKKIIRTINPTANNSANYVKKIPILFPNNEEQLEYINDLVLDIIDSIKNDKDDEVKVLQDEMDDYFNKLYFE